MSTDAKPPHKATSFLVRLSGQQAHTLWLTLDALRSSEDPAVQSACARVCTQLEEQGVRDIPPVRKRKGSGR